MRRLIGVFLLAALWGGAAGAGEVARGDLAILGLGLEVGRQPVVTAVDIPASVQTIFGGKTNDDAPSAPGLSALGDLTGPGIDTPITLVTKPGHPFQLPALHEKGEYTLQNIRLAGESGEFLQQSVPSFAVIQVSDVLQTSVRVRQLTAAELRERGINVDSRNYEVYEYTFVFGVDASTVEVPYAVIVDKRTHVLQPIIADPYQLPPLTYEKPPRFTPPQTHVFDLGQAGPLPPGNDPLDKNPPAPPSIPAALIVPNGFGVLHQFFAVILHVDNVAPEGSEIRLDSVNATIAAPLQLRVAKVMPAVSVGQAVPIKDEVTGATFLVAGGKGSAEWTLEALKTGTHTVNIEVNATYHKPGQEDFPLRGRVSTSLVVSDPRFHINFSHPETVRKDEPYTAYAFITNLSAQRQHVMLDTNAIPKCSSGGAFENICRTTGDGVYELDIEAGEMATVPYALTSKINGRVFAAAGSANDETIGVSVQLTMGVSASGIPLSPATLVMPYYTRFLPAGFVDAQMRLLGLGYSVATAPLNKFTARLPRVIKTDVFTRAQQIARAGQRIFITNPAANADAMPHLALDLLANTERVDQQAITPELQEWDELRRTEEAGRAAGAAMARELEHGFDTPREFVDNFASATSHRAPFLFAYVHGEAVTHPRPYALSIAGVSSETLMDVHAEAGVNWVRTLRYGELTRFNLGGHAGELAIVGRWSETYRVVVLPQSTAFTLHLLYPDTENGAMLRADVDITGATVGSRVVVELARGARTLNVQYATGVASIAEVAQAPLAVSAAAQDMYLDNTGHVVTMLFNRPVTMPANVALRDRLALTINVPKANYTVTRRNTAGAELQIPGAVIQSDGRIVTLTFDKTLSRNANYEIAVDTIHDLLSGSNFTKSGIVPRIDNDRPGAILTGRVLRADNTPVPGVLVQLSMKDVPVMTPDGGTVPRDIVQHDIAGADGRFLYEFVPRDVDSGIFGLYDLETESPEGLRTTLSGAVRLPAEVHTANLVFLGRGRAVGQVRYDDGTPIPGVVVSIGSTLYPGLLTGITDANGHYDIDGLPVAPLTFSVVDPDGRTTFAASQLKTPGEVLTQNLIVLRKEAPGRGTVRLTVKRSDTGAAVAGAQVGVSSQGYPLQESFTDADGRAEFRDVPAGLVTLLASQWSISRHAAGIEVDLRADETIDQVLTLQIADITAKYATLEGTITRDDPSSPGDASKDVLVPGAIVTVGNRPAVTAGADGNYVVLDLPVAPEGTSQGNVAVTVFDPSSGRKGWFLLPTLVEGTNHFSMRLTSRQPDGVATMRIRLYGPQSEPVSGYRVLTPGYPPTRFTEKQNGVYELADVSVPRDNVVFAVPENPNGAYGDQLAQGRVRVDFHGQVGVTDLRLPGSGTIVVRLEVEGSCAGCPPTQAIGPVAVTYYVWDDAAQGLYPKTIELAPDPISGLITIPKVPARQDVTLATVRNPAGYASAVAYLAYDGDVRNVTLRMKTIGDVTGRVLAHDGVTPVSGATVRINTGTATYSPVLTRPDGTFTFFAIPAATSFEITAELNQDGLYRIGHVFGRTPDGGGPVSNLLITMREQSTVEGRVVDNVSGAIVPLARYWLRELAWPYRTIGTPRDPLFADINGRFVVANVFTGAFRITAVHPGNQEVRGDYQGELTAEGDATQRAVEVRVGGVGTGAISITVLDPLRGFVPVENAEVTLLLNENRFDFTTTNENGIAFFDQVPAVGNYRATAYSKSLGRAGAGTPFGVTTGQTTSSSVPLEFRGLVTGTMTDPESEPPNLPVQGAPVTLSGSLATRDSTDENGAFEFDGVPEGNFSLFGYQSTSDRYAFGPAGLFISKLVPEQRNIHLELERTGTLTVKVYLPDDSGGPGELAPLAEVTACQCRESLGEYSYLRGAQGNPLVFSKMLRRMGYTLTVAELGGEARTVRVGGAFGPNEYTKEQIVVLPTSGSVEVTVVDAAGVPVADAQVRINDRTMYTPANGVVSISGMPFGWITAQAQKGNVAASGGGDLHSRTQPLRLTLNLGSSISVAGSVEAEGGNGAPSVRTRVVLNVTSRLLASPQRLETLTGSDGTYTFTGIPVGGTTLSFLFYGPDDTTIGAARSVTVPDGSTGTITIPAVRLDATPPRVLSIDPPSNSTNVSPSTSITITFSEPIAPSYLNTQWFQLVATDNSALVNVSFDGSVRPDGTYIVRLTPPAAPAGQTFPLKSNVLYRFAIPQGLADTTGNTMAAAVGSSFTTVNYTEPDVVRIDPSTDGPLFEGATFRVKFNKPIDADAGFAVLERLDRHHGIAVEELPVSRYVDPADPSTLVVAPTGVAIAESSFYRLRLAEIRDTQTPSNAMREQRTYDWVSFDTKKPVVTIVSPAEQLVSGVLYTVTANVTDDGGAEASDVAYVDWLDGNGVAIGRGTPKPYAYSFTAPSTSTPATFTLKASATDFSNNTSAVQAVKTWDVIPNEAPRVTAVTNTPASLHAGASVETRVRFTDEGVAASVVLELRGTNVDGSELRQVVGSRNVTRGSTSAEFAEQLFTWNAPLTIGDGAASVVAIVTDSANKSGNASAELTIVADANPPQFLSLTPRAETRYRYGVTNQFTIELQVRDDETAVARTTFSVNGTTVLDATSGIYDAVTRVTTFRATVNVLPRNADTRIPIIVTATDARGNVQTETRDVIYERVEDARVPNAAWLTPLDGAALPSNQANWLTTLRIRATDDQRVTSVRFESSALAAPITLTDPKNGTPDIFEAKAVLTMPADGSSFVIKAIVADGDPTHDVELPITIDPVVAAPVINTDINISSITAGQYANKSLLVRGARVYITVPLALADLMLVDGATLSVSEETKLDVTITNRLFVDGDSRIDVSGKGWLGGLARREDNSFTNPSLSGRAPGGIDGALHASASHAGIGGAFEGSTNATYGSFSEPADFGAGGSASANAASAGGNGGGAMRLSGDRFVLAGSTLANGVSGANGVNGAFGGAGGSIDLRARALVTSPVTRISANGADDDADAETDMGGGGGRIALRITERLDAQSSQWSARGGRNGANEEGAQYVDGGAGTIYVVAPDGARTLTVSSRDERFASTAHRAMGTPLGALDVDAIEIGPRALARFDVAPAIAPTVDATATAIAPNVIPAITLHATTPAANGSVAQNTKIEALFDASSPVGIREVRAMLDVQPSDGVAYPQFVSTLSNATISANVPSDAPAGSATLKLVVRDRSGRTSETSVIPFAIVTNAGAVVETFDVTPPAETYAGRTLTVAATASDDIAVTSLTLASSLGSVTADSATKPTPQTMARTFSVALPPAATPGSNVTLTLSALDDFPGRIATTATKSIAILHDTIPPSVSIAKPAANETFQEGSGATFAIEVAASDAEVAVKNVVAAFEGSDTPLTFTNDAWRATLSVPNIDGTEPAAKTLTINAYDYEGNVSTSSVTIFIQPLIDPNAPALAWLCGSPGAMAPAGIAVPLRVSAIPSSGANGVQSVTIAIGNNAPVAATSAGTNLYQTTFTIPAGTAEGTTFDVRVVARSVAGNESTLLGTLTAVTGTIINTTSSISASDTAFDDQSLIVTSGGTLTITGPHRFRNLVVLDGGKVVQKHVDLGRGDLLTLEKLFVACNATVDVTGLGYARNVAHPGAGTPDDASGGSHIGRGGVWRRSAGGVFGSITMPLEPGGGGHASDPALAPFMAYGGGVIRMHAHAGFVIDGTLKANGVEQIWWGAGAGGSIWLSTPAAIGGAGSIEAIGPYQNALSGGGGGAIALEYANASGTLLSHVSARGSRTDGSVHEGSAGSIYLKRAGTTFGDLIINNEGGASIAHSLTELPSLGRATAGNVSGDVVSIADVQWLSPSLAGHSLRAFAPNGAVRGTWSIAEVLNDSGALTLNGSFDVLTQDAIAYDGYVVYTPGRVTGRPFLAARYINGRWEYDSDSAFVPFTPNAADALIASFTKNGSAITSLVTFDCASGCTTIQGIPAIELHAGELLPNTIGGRNGGHNEMNSGLLDDAELFLRPDSRFRGVILTRGVDARVRLAGAPNLVAGDTLRGVYRFDNITLATARVFTRDLVESTNAPILDASSSLSFNVDAPTIDASRVSVTHGPNGAELVGSAGAVTDPDGPLFVVARNEARAASAQPIVWNKTIEISFGDKGGASARRIFNSLTDTVYGVRRASALNVITASGFLSFSASQTNARILVGLAPADTTGDYEEPGTNAFHLKNDGSYEIWANGQNISKNGAYTTRSVFRIEKTPSLLRWYVDGVLKHEQAAPATPLRPDLSFASANDGEIHGLAFGNAGTDSGSDRASVAADGSFRLPIAGQPGDALTLSAYDAHDDSFASKAIPAGTFPSGVGVASITFDPAEVTGGRASTGTVTLLAPASAEGAIVELASGNSIASVSSRFTIAAGATSGTFPINTTAVTTPIDVTISASHGGIGTSATLRIVKDNIAPTVTTTLAPNSEVTEGPDTKLFVSATASDADSGIQRVEATFDGQTFVMTKSGASYTAVIPMPYVDGTSDVTKNVVITAIDNSGNSASTAAIPIVIHPVIDSAAPTVSWLCASDGAMYAVNTNATLRVLARAPNATNVLQNVELIVTAPGGNVTTYTATKTAVDTYEAVVPVGDVADRAVFTARALVTAISGTTAESTVGFSAVRGAFEVRSNTVISASDFSKDNASIVVISGTLTIAGTHTFDRLVVQGGSLNPEPGSALSLTAASTFIACGAQVNAIEAGYASFTTYPNVSGPNAANHIGRSGGTSAPGLTYGSVYRPRELGASALKSGGGAIRIQSPLLVLDGAIHATSASGGSFNGGGAGGSVWLQTQTIRGTGSVHATGGFGCPDGGGGAIAIEYTNASSVVPVTIATAGGSSCNANGGAGIVYLKRPTSIHGDAIIDAGSNTGGITELPSLGSGLAQNGSSGITLVTDRTANIPAFFEGHWIEIAGKGTWRIATINAKSVTLAPNGSETISIAAGDAWRGVYRFDSLRLRNGVRLLSGDRLDVTTVDKDASSTITINDAAPVIDTTKLTLTSTSGGGEITGTTGAVTDSDTPITVIATNTRTSQTYSVTAAANGSFTMSVAGNPGDTFTLRARDGHIFPLTSLPVAVPGQLLSATGLISIAIDPSTVEGGTTVNGTVTLATPAPAGGATITLSSGDARATTPASVFIPQGGRSAVFGIFTSRVVSTTNIAISATWDVTLSANLVLTPCPSLTAVSQPASVPSTIWFDDAPPSGTVSATPSFDATQSANGAQSLHFVSASGMRTWSLTNATPLAVTPADRLELYALVNPCDPPREILVTWSDGTNAYRVAWGETRIDATLSQLYAGAVPRGAQWTRLDVLASALGITSTRNLTGLTIQVDGGEAWLDVPGVSLCSTAKAAKPEYLAGEVVWVDETWPSGASTPSYCAGPNWDATQVASGTTSDLVGATQHCFLGATSNGLPLAMNDVLVLYVFLDPCDPPREVMVQLNNGGWNRRAYWGEDLVAVATPYTNERWAMGALPEAGTWTRLEIPISSMNLQGATLEGIALTLSNGRAWFDRIGKVARTNLALHKTASQSSTLQPYGPELAVDGNFDNFQHTLTEPRPYWEVDLGSVQPIEEIGLWGRDDCCTDRTRNVHVLISDEPFISTDLDTVLSAQPGVSSFLRTLDWGRPTPLMIHRTGRYLRVHSLQSLLNFSEVQVWAPVSPGKPMNLAGGRSATQSSTHSDSTATYDARLAVNGGVFNGDFSHTLNQSEARWEVDLGSVQQISTVDVFNTLNPDRMGNAYLFVSDAPFTGTSVASALAQPGVSVYYRGPALTMRQFAVHRTGRYVRLQLAGASWLHPMEVSIWSPTRTLGALAKPLFDFATATPSNRN
ncbi:MAG TPA: Ig-like domain-containing protein [Thermoanaerobaculia bacterium]|nr:Ig-like domain-containing protein [Thermoanaerobaculia bacterium]